MKIGELARRSGLSTSTIRFYESKGLLQAVSRQENGYRDYPLEAVAMLNIITNAQQTGFSLEEIRQVLPQDLSQWRHDDLIKAIERKVADIEAMEVKLAQNKAQLQFVLQMIEGKPDGMACADNASRVLTTLGVPLPKA